MSIGNPFEHEGLPAGHCCFCGREIILSRTPDDNVSYDCESCGRRMCFACGCAHDFECGCEAVT